VAEVGRTIVTAYAVAAALFVYGCGSDTPAAPADVTSTTWRLQSLQRGDASVVSPPAGTFTVRFAEGRVEVRADCNSCGGSYALSAGILDVGLLACTRAFCPSAPFDTEYVRLVEAATTVERADDVLILRSPSGVARFIR